MNQVYQRLRESQIQPIFAVSQYARKTFEVVVVIFHACFKRVGFLANTADKKVKKP